jgi:universal stress protein A
MTTPMRMLVPIDFTESSKAAYAYALFLGERFGASIYLLHVLESSRHLSRTLSVVTEGGAKRTIEELERTSASRAMEEFLSGIEKSDLVKVHSRLSPGDVVETIIRMATAEKYDLIVMSSHGRAGLLQLIEGSKVERVVRLAPCPVVAVPG